MEIKKVREHTCFQNKGKGPLSPEKCRCRKYVTTEQARVKVNLGIAEYVRVGVKSVPYEQECTHCDDKYRRSCLVCSGTGVEKKTRKEPILGEDIITTVNSEGKRTTTTQVKKSPTIEEGHILRGLEESDFGLQARNRWDEYGLIMFKERIRLLVVETLSIEEFNTYWKLWELDTSQPFPLTLRLEPIDDLHTHTGRRYDYGRSV